MALKLGHAVEAAQQAKKDAEAMISNGSGSGGGGGGEGGGGCSGLRSVPRNRGAGAAAVDSADLTAVEALPELQSSSAT
jgi:hypothetical protein